MKKKIEVSAPHRLRSQLDTLHRSPRWPQQGHHRFPALEAQVKEIRDVLQGVIDEVIASADPHYMKPYS